MKRTKIKVALAAALMLLGVCVFAEDAPGGFVKITGGAIAGKKNAKNYDGVFTQGRAVTLSPFYIAKYEVTQSEYKEVMTGQKTTVNGAEYELNASPSKNAAGQENLPVENVSWYDAVYYCNAKSAKEGLSPAYKIEVTGVGNEGNITAATVTLIKKANGYRLPTEAEWEYAARGGDAKADEWDYTFSGVDTTRTDWNAKGNIGLDAVGWYGYNSDDKTHPVGEKKPNRLGIYDMSGNVWEWCYDLHDNNITAGSVTDPIGAEVAYSRVYRGGSWNYFAYFAASCYRSSNAPSGRNGGLGFRVARSVSE